jgi:hypothetical protein
LGALLSAGAGATAFWLDFFSADEAFSAFGVVCLTSVEGLFLLDFFGAEVGFSSFDAPFLLATMIHSFNSTNIHLQHQRAYFEPTA